MRTLTSRRPNRVIRITQPLASVSLLAVAAFADAQTRDQSEGRTLEEVVVTAQKREEAIQDVPISMSVIGTQALEAPAVQSLRDALRVVPGIAVREESQSGTAKYAVRGVVSNASLFNGSPTIGFYLDEIPFAFVRFPVTPDTNAYDLERVEVLRGPQGTLYGANSLNGVVRVITKDANLEEFEGKARGTVSSTRYGGINYGADAALNVPVLPGKLAVRAVGGYAESSGWIDAPPAGLTDTNDGEQRNLRLKVNSAPTDNLRVDLLTWLSRNDRGATSQSMKARTRAAGLLEEGSQDFDAFGLTVTYDFPAFSLLSSTSKLNFESESHNSVPAAGGFADFLVNLESDLKSEEIRLNSNSDGPWTWSLGGIYRDVEDHRVQDDLTNRLITGVVNQVYLSESYAAYGELKRRLGERFSLTAGLRYFEDDVTTTEISGPSITDIPFGSKTESFSATTPRIVLAYEPSEQTNLYASYSEGFRSGFTQDAVILRFTGGFARSVEPDRLRNYEIGAKGRAFDNRLIYDTAVYFIDWEDTIQSVSFNFGTPAFPVITNGGVNSEAAQGMGVDLGLSLSATDNFTIGGTVSWNDLHFVADVRGATGVVFPKDSRPQESPEWTAGAFADYSLPLHNAYQIRVGGSLNYMSKMVNPGPNGPLQSGDDLLYARASISLESPHAWELTLFGDNLTNEDGAIRPTVSGAAGEADRYRPQTVGLQLYVQF